MNKAPNDTTDYVDVPHACGHTIRCPREWMPPATLRDEKLRPCRSCRRVERAAAAVRNQEHGLPRLDDDRATPDQVLLAEEIRERWWTSGVGTLPNPEPHQRRDPIWWIAQHGTRSQKEETDKLGATYEKDGELRHVSGRDQTGHQAATPSRDAKKRALALACPTCKAQPNEPCHDPTGKERAAHVTRCVDADNLPSKPAESPKDPDALLLMVSCPGCAAKVGQPCQGLAIRQAGRPLYHGRRRDAWIKHQEDLTVSRKEPETVKPSDIKHRKPVVEYEDQDWAELAATSERRQDELAGAATISHEIPTPPAPRVLEEIPVSAIARSPLNPRREFDGPADVELVESIKEHGIIEPLVVRRQGGVQTPFSLLAGERRWRCAMRAGLATVPCRLLEAQSDAEALAIMLTENLQRRDLNVIEEAAAYAQLVELGMTQTAIAKSLGKSQPAIANAIRLLALPPQVAQMVIEGKITTSHARALIKWADDPARCLTIAERAIALDWTSRDLERMATNKLGISEYEATGAAAAAEAPPAREVLPGGDEEVDRATGEITPREQAPEPAGPAVPQREVSMAEMGFERVYPPTQMFPKQEAPRPTVKELASYGHQTFGLRWQEANNLAFKMAGEAGLNVADPAARHGLLLGVLSTLEYRAEENLTE